MTAPKPILLAETDWKFDSIPTNELEACCLYEYSRAYFDQSQTLQKLRARWQAYQAWRKAHTDPLRTRWEAYQILEYEYNQSLKSNRPPLPKPVCPPLPIPKPTKTPINHKIGQMAHEYARLILSARQGFAAPMDFRTFPAVPWQELPKRPRWEAWPVQDGIRAAEDRQRGQKYKGDRFHIETLEQLAPANITDLPGWIYYHEFFHRHHSLSNTQHGFFSINWDYPLPEIERAFGQWLREQANIRKVKPTITPGPSRGQWKDKLRWLGALRFKKHYPYRDLVDSGDDALKIMPAPYFYYPALRANAAKAARLISEMFPSEHEAAKIAALPTEKLE